MAFCKLVTVLVLIHNTGGLLGAKLRSSIVGGRDAQKGSWPWMVYLNITHDGTTSWRCGGTIVGDDWVLTSASCWNKQPDPKAARSMAWIGSHKLKDGAERYMGIVYVVTPSEYQAVGSGYKNDLALVKLKKKLKFSKTVKKLSVASSRDTFGPSSECWITGWGNTDTDVPLRDPEVLQELKISILPQSVCKATHPELTSDQLCAGDMAGGKDACKGDYGGPLVCRGAKGFMQVGIMSYGSPNGCGLPGHPGVYTLVSKHEDYIDYYIHHTEEASAEV